MARGSMGSLKKKHSREIIIRYFLPDLPLSNF